MRRFSAHIKRRSDSAGGQNTSTCGKKMHRSLRLLVVLSAVLFCAFSVREKAPFIRLPRDTETTGRYIVVLKEDTSHEQLTQVVKQLSSYDGCVVHKHVEIVLKAIVMDISGAALEKVICSYPGSCLSCFV